LSKYQYKKNDDKLPPYNRILLRLHSVNIFFFIKLV